MSKPKKKGKFILVGLIIIGLAGFVGMNMMNQQTRAYPVSYSLAGNSMIQSFVSTSGSVKKGEEVEYIVTGSATVSKVNFKTGDRVAAGNIIVQYENSDAKEQYRRAEIAYEKMRLDIEDTEINYYKQMEKINEATAEMNHANRQRKDYHETEDGYAKFDSIYTTWKSKKESLEDSLPTEAKLRAQQLSFEEAGMNLKKAQDLYNELPKNVVAEGSGVIVSVGVRELTDATKGGVAAIIRYDAKDIVEFKISKYDLPKIEIGQKTDVTIGRSTYNGTVSNIGNEANEKGEIIAEVTVTAPDELFIAGLEADVEIMTYSNENTLSLPVENIKSDRNGEYCYTLTPGTEPETYIPAKTYIKTGESSDLLIEIKDGLKDGDMVVYSPPSNIDTLTVVSATPAAV